jgi:hypothetical protein
VREGHLRWLARSAARARRRAGGKEGAGELRYTAINSAPALAGQLVACSRQRRRERDGRAEEEKDARRAACLRPLLRWGRAVGRMRWMTKAINGSQLQRSLFWVSGVFTPRKVGYCNIFRCYLTKFV